MDRHPNTLPHMFVVPDTLHIFTKFQPEFLPNWKLHSFLAIQLTTIYDIFIILYFASLPCLIEV